MQQAGPWRLALLASLILAGCSSSDSLRRAERGYDYLETDAASPLVVPAGIDAPAYYDDYEIPKLTAGADLSYVGEKVDIRAPAQVIALNRNSRLDPSTTDAHIIFDTASNRDVLRGELNRSIQLYLKNKNIKIAQLSPDMVVTDPVVTEFQMGSGFRKTDHRIVEQIEYSLLDGDRAGSVTLAVTLRQYTQTIDDAKVELNDYEWQRREILVLNNFMVNYEAEQERIRNAGQTVVETANFSSSVNENDLGIIMVDAGFDDVWELMPDILAVLGFTIDSKDLVNGSMNLVYTASDRAESEGEAPYTLEDGDYQLQFGDLDGTTSMSLFDEDKLPVSKAVMNALAIEMQRISN